MSFRKPYHMPFLKFILPFILKGFKIWLLRRIRISISIPHDVALFHNGYKMIAIL